MTSYEPWIEEPFGPEYALMLRANHFGAGDELAAKMGDTFVWPEHGYVEAPELDGPRGQKGLFGFLHGTGDLWTAPWAWGCPDGAWAIFKVKLSEIVQCDYVENPKGLSRYDRALEWKTPRAWVKYSGTFYGVLLALAQEPDPHLQNRVFIYNALLTLQRFNPRKVGLHDAVTIARRIVNERKAA